MTDAYRIICPKNLLYALYVGLKNIPNSEHFLSEEEQALVKSWLGVDDSEFVKKTDNASDGVLGLVKGGNIYNNAVYINTVDVFGNNAKFTLFVNSANETNIRNRTKPRYGDGVGVIAPDNMDLALKIALTTNTAEWTDAEKESARTLLGANRYSHHIVMYDSLAPVKRIFFTINSNSNEEMTIDDIKNYLEGFTTVPLSDELTGISVSGTFVENSNYYTTTHIRNVNGNLIVLAVTTNGQKTIDVSNYKIIDNVR